MNVPDPYEEADANARRAEEEARLITPPPVKKRKTLLVVGLVFVGVFFALVIVAQVAGMLWSKKGPDRTESPKPVTMTQEQSDRFAKQQAGQADYLKGVDKGRSADANDEAVMGHGNDLAGDKYQEADGVPPKTQAQDDAVRGGNSGGSKSEAQQRREHAAAEAANRRKNDLESSSLSVDFSDYFNKQKTESADNSHVKDQGEPVQRRRSALEDPLNDEPSQAGTAEVSSKKMDHDPKKDYEFDSAAGKLFRLMEDTVLETVLVNRISGASVGPIITMITTDVYSMNGGHLLIPKGTRILGSVTAVASMNQERLFVAFHRMIMPDGYSVSLDKFQGLDVVGQAGLRDLVNHHYLKIFGTSIALAAIAATAQIGNNSSFGTYDWGVQMRSGISESMSQSSQRILERFMNTLPTFTIRERTRVKIMLSGDLLLPDIKNHTMDPDI
jgi:type IV secretion system protein TrbI